MSLNHERANRQARRKADSRNEYAEAAHARADRQAFFYGGPRKPKPHRSKETVEEFLARGGQIQQLRPSRAQGCWIPGRSCGWPSR